MPRLPALSSSLSSALALCGALAACGYVDYRDAPSGTFSGDLFVMWVGEGQFLFVPNRNNPLIFTWTDDQGRRQSVQPEMMYTDGGSIPPIGQLFNGFGPWGYAPAYMIHDWLFTARHCIVDGTPTPAEARVAGISFQQSAVLLASSIQALVTSGRVKDNDLAGQAISGAVAGPIARARWNEKGACADLRVSEKHRLAAEAAMPGASSSALRRSGVAPAAIVGAFSF